MGQLHVVSVADAAPKAEGVYFVLQRLNGHWSRGAKIMEVFASESLAETHAANLKDQYPLQCFGVAALRSEARMVEHPIEIVRVVQAEQASA